MPSNSSPNVAAQTLDFPSLASLFPPSSTYIKDHGWVAVIGATLLSFGCDGPLIEQLADAIIAQCGVDNQDGQLAAFRKLREALLKAGPLSGFPRSINALTTLHAYLTTHHAQLSKRLYSDPPLRALIPLAARHARGRAFFDRIYAHHAAPILQRMSAASCGELPEFALNSVYGDLLAEFSVLGEQETVLVEFVACLALGTGAQAKGHMYGSRNVGNSGAEIVAARELVRKVAAALGVRWSEEGMEWLGTPEAKGW